MTALGVALAAPASASVSAKISSFPYTQDWSTLSSLSTWADFPGVEGFTTGTHDRRGESREHDRRRDADGRGDAHLQPRAAVDRHHPQHRLDGGVLGFYAVTDKTVALSATSAFPTPVLVFHLDTTGKTGIGFAYDVEDLDSSADDQPTRVALQYRVGTSGAYTNVPEAYLADATTKSNTTVVTTHVSVTLPSAVDAQSDVYVRVITLDNASGSNEHIGIDNISITTAGDGGPTLAAPTAFSSPAAGELTVGTVGVTYPTTNFIADGTPTPTYSLGDGTYPPGLSLSDAGVLTGTPTIAGDYSFVVSATNSEGSVASDAYDLHVAASLPSSDSVVIDEVWGDGGFTGAPWKNNFIELYNQSDRSVDLSDYSIGYAPYNYNGSTGLQQSDLTGTIPAHGYYLIGGTPSASSTGAGADLPVPDDTSSITWHYADGLIVLLETQDAVNVPTGGNIVGDPDVVDAVGYGLTTGGFPVSTYEGTPTGFNTGAKGASRDATTHADTNNNAADFTLADTTPTNRWGETSFVEHVPTAITTETLPLARINTAYTATVEAIGAAPITFKTRSADLPTGVTFDGTTGILSGTPTVSGEYAFTVTAEGPGGSAERTYTLDVALASGLLALTTDTPTIGGEAVVGGTLTADEGAWTPGTDFSYQWYRAGSPVDAATHATYAVTTADLKKNISLRVTGTKDGYHSATTIAATVAIGYGLLTPGTLSLPASSRVDDVLTPQLSGWPDGTTPTFTWFRAGSQVATGSSYALTTADFGKNIVVKAAATLDGYRTADGHASAGAQSNADTVTYGVLTPGTVSLPASSQVGQTLTPSADGWADGVQLSYTWFRAGIQVATGSSYALTAADLKKNIVVKAAATREGYRTADGHSAAAATSGTDTVAYGAIAAFTPVISGAAAVTSVLSVIGLPSLPDGAVVSYQWTRAGLNVSTGPTYTVASNDYAKNIGVKVNITAPGYTSQGATSAKLLITAQ